jgi:hypothetical protein
MYTVFDYEFTVTTKSLLRKRCIFLAITFLPKKCDIRRDFQTQFYHEPISMIRRVGKKVLYATEKKEQLLV